MTSKDLVDIMQKIILQETIWLRHYIGKVVDINDPLKKARIKVIIYDLGFDTASIGFWCYPRNLNSITTPKINDWVEVYFLNGDRDRPVYMGKANEIKDMLPKNYDNKPKSNVIFEDVDNKIKIKFDGDTNTMEMGKSNFQKAARENDTIIIDATTDPINWPLLVAAGFAGTSLNGKINSGSNQTKIGDQ